MAKKIVQTAGRTKLGEFAPEFAHYNDDILFDGQDRAKLRKYSLELKYMVAEENEQRPADDPLRDEMGEIIEIPVAG